MLHRVQMVTSHRGYSDCCSVHVLVGTSEQSHRVEKVEWSEQEESCNAVIC